MASVSARRNKDGSLSWRVNFRIEGRQVQETFSHPDSKMAEKAARSFAKLVDRVGGEAARAIRISREALLPTVTFADFAKRYVDESSGLLTGVEPRTRRDYETLLTKSLLPYFGPIPIESITETDVGKWVQAEEATKISAKTVKNRQVLLSAILNAAVKEKLIDTNPARGARISRGTRRRIRVISREQFEKLIEQIPEYYRPLFRTLVETGARWSEVTALTGGDFYTDANGIPMVSINKAWKLKGEGGSVLGAPKSDAGIRDIPITPELRELIGEVEPDQLVFRGKLSGERIWIGMITSRIWKPSLERAGLSREFRIHDLRHTHVSWLLAANVPIHQISRRVGHESINTTVRVYGHLLGNANAEMVKALRRAG